MNQINVLDKGFVRLVDHMGSDSAIVQAARTSYGAGTKTVKEDRGLIRYLVRNAHTSPLEMVEFKFHMKMPIFIARQHIRHRTASLNEMSARYSIMKDEFFIPSEVRGQSTSNKQCSSDELVESSFVQELENMCHESYETYERAIASGVSREIARTVLPVNLYTEMYWKMDLHNLLHYLKLRLHPHAQKEIQVYAQAMLDLIRPIVPVAIEAFEDYILYSVTLSAKEVDLINQALEYINSDGFNYMMEQHLTTQEIKEFKEKFTI